MIYIASAGRSGSGWLCALLTACSLRVVHEWFPFNVIKPDAQAETEWVHDQEAFWNALSPNDTLIVLDRNWKARRAAVKRLFGEQPSHDLDTLWSQFVCKAAEGLHQNTHFLSYEKLFDTETRDRLHHILFAAGHSTSNLDNAFNFLRNMRVTNKVSETAAVNLPAECFGALREKRGGLRLG